MSLSFWVKAWDTNIPYSPLEIANNVEILKQWHQKKKDSLQFIWQAPSEGMLKWNVDGVERGKPGKDGIGGILRDCTSDYHCILSKAEGIQDSNEAEFLAIVHAIEILREKE